MHDYRKQDTDHDKAMTKESAFKAWLGQGGVQTTSGRTRASAIRTIERKLQELEMPFRDLNEAWKADRFCPSSE